MRAFTPFITVAAIAVSSVTAVCPGYDFAFQDRGYQNYVLLDTSCNGVETFIYNGVNACTQGTLKCSPPPITITDVLAPDGYWYACQSDANSGSCVGWHNTYCCWWNGGARSLKEGEDDVPLIGNTTTEGVTFAKDA
ncbi:hypothetical protein ONZ51_g823 [Trametes cubensis]|uniref:Uncharacterized protein n=1 Tax=Trametes cubensis TaxID=1111947 RepID=A0AAD7U2N1_9APHY|nr:hypothetical protein ONZ51_g823 [Trametes cubensis]